MSSHRRDPQAVPWTRRPRRRLDWNHSWRIYGFVLVGMPALVVSGASRLLTSGDVGNRLLGIGALLFGGIVLVFAVLYVRRPAGVGE